MIWIMQKTPQLNEEINFLNLCNCPENYLLPCFFSALNKHILRGMYLNLKHPSHLIRSNAAFIGEKYFWKMLRLFIVCLKIILRSRTGKKKKKEVSFFMFCIHVLFCGVCTTKMCLSATSDVKVSVRQFAVFHMYIRVVLLKCAKDRVYTSWFSFFSSFFQYQDLACHDFDC